MRLKHIIFVLKSIMKQILKINMLKAYEKKCS